MSKRSEDPEFTRRGECLGVAACDADRPTQQPSPPHSAPPLCPFVPLSLRPFVAAVRLPCVPSSRSLPAWAGGFVASSAVCLPCVALSLRRFLTLTRWENHAVCI